MFAYYFINKLPIIIPPPPPDPDTDPVLPPWAEYNGSNDPPPIIYADNPRYQKMAPLSGNRVVIAYRRRGDNVAVMQVITHDNQELQLTNETIIYPNNFTYMSLSVDKLSGNGIMLLRSAPYNYPIAISFLIAADNSITIGQQLQLANQSIHYPSIVMLDQQTALIAVQDTTKRQGSIGVIGLDPGNLAVTAYPWQSFEIGGRPYYISLNKQSEYQALLSYRSGVSGAKASLLSVSYDVQTRHLSLSSPLTISPGSVNLCVQHIIDTSHSLIAYRDIAGLRVVLSLIEYRGNGVFVIKDSMLLLDETVDGVVTDITLTVVEGGYMLAHLSIKDVALKSLLVHIDNQELSIIRSIIHRAVPTDCDYLVSTQLTDDVVLLAARDTANGNDGVVLVLGV